MDDAVDLVGRIGKIRRSRGFAAPSLVDREIHDHRPWFHRMQHVAGDQDRRPFPVDRHRTEKEVRKGQGLLDVGRRRRHRRDLIGGRPLDAAQGLNVAVEDDDVGAEPAPETGGLPSQGSGAENHQRRRRNAGGAVDQQTLAAELVEQQPRTDDHRQTPGDLRHRLENGSVAVVLLDDLDADGRQFPVKQRPETGFRRDGEMPGSQDDLPRLEPLVFLGGRGRHPDDELGA